MGFAMALDRKVITNWSYMLAPFPGIAACVYLLRQGYSSGQAVLASGWLALSIMLIGLLVQPPGAMRSLQWGIWVIAGVFLGTYWFFYK